MLTITVVVNKTARAKHSLPNYAREICHAGNAELDLVREDSADRGRGRVLHAQHRQPVVT